jgi:CO/xanthine dehydrogenase Mo-binding subunit
MTKTINTLDVSRRDLLAGTGALTIAVVLPGATGRVRAASPLTDSRTPLDPTRLATYVSIDGQGNAVGWIGKIDMGQGTDIGWIQMIAEELDLPVERVSVVQGHTDQTFNMGGASGSTGIQRGGKVMRQAAAEARRILVEMAAEKLSVPADHLKVDNGIVSDSADPSKKVTYAELIGGRQFGVELKWNNQVGSGLDIEVKAKPKSPKDYKIVGKTSPLRRDVAPKVMAEFDYMVDVKVPGMLHGRVIRPAIAGAMPMAVDESSIKDIPGARVVHEKGFIGVVAPKEWDAIKAAERLKVTWSDAKPPFPEYGKLFDYISAANPTKGEVPINKGNVEDAFAKAARVVEATYNWPFQSHACMAPACGVADVRPGEARIWTGSQKAHYARDGVAVLLGLPPEKVVAKNMVGPGSYGRNDSGDAVMDAAVLSRAVGAPVRVQGMRYEGTGWDPKAPASVHTTRAAIDKDGNVTACQYHIKGFSRRETPQNESAPEYTLAGQLLDYRLRPVHYQGVPEDSYEFGSIRKSWETIGPLLERGSPLRTSHLRDPGGPATVFASESFMDEVAFALGQDPLEFRLRYLRHPRDIAVAKAAAEKAGWKPRVGPQRASGDVVTGRGLAVCQRSGTRVAMIAEVEVNRRTGHVWARKFTVAHDCGQIINPGLLRQTIEGNVVQSTSRALLEEVVFDQSKVTSIDWQTYPILDMADAPETIDIVLIDRPDVAPSGAGEATTRPTAAALANAIFDATGVRVRQAPLSPLRLKAALA